MDKKQEKAKGEADFSDLVKRVQKEGGFVYATHRQSQEPYDKTMYSFDRRAGHQSYSSLCAVRGINHIGESVASVSAVEQVTGKIRFDNITEFMKQVDEVDRPVYEIILSGEMSSFVGENGHTQSLTTDQVLYTSDSKRVAELTYCAKRGPLLAACTEGEPKEADGSIVTVNQTLISDQETITELMKCIEDDPNRVAEIFKGVFPKLEAKYSTERNGRILSLDKRELGLLKNPDMIERKAVDYEPKEADAKPEGE